MRTVSRKSERLVNLTIALLATKRYLTKSEIFRTVEGYEGAPEAMERMFERDKDDLRSLGISIELGTFDPLFEDEAGYRITPSSYQLDLGNLDGTDIAFLSLAASAWSGAALEKESTSAVIKLESMGIECDVDALATLSPRVQTQGSNFAIVTDAIIRKAQLSFEYLSSDLSISEKKVYPYGLRGDSGLWYLVGLDLEHDALRTYRLDRITSEVTSSKKSNLFTAPASLPEPQSQAHESAIVNVRKGSGFQLRNIATSVTAGDEWDELEIPIINPAWIVRTILWHGDDVYVSAPSWLRSQIIDSLKEMRALHG